MNGIVTKFPNARGWIKWYMRASIAPHIFPACNSALDDPILGERLKTLSKDTNLQEGTGSALKTFLGGDKNHPNELIQSIFWWVREMSTQHRLAKQGIYTLSKCFQNLQIKTYTYFLMFNRCKHQIHKIHQKAEENAKKRAEIR